MLRSPWFTLVLGLMVGLAVGYALAERQPVPPARALAAARVGGSPARGAQGMQGMPEGHPPISEGTSGAESVDQKSRRLKDMQAQRPDDPNLMVGLGNLYFDAARWPDARIWYEKALERKGDDPDVITDLAVVYRNLKQPDRSLELLERALKLKPEHWQAWYNKVIVLNYDLHQHDQAVTALARLKEIRRANPQIPELASLERDVLGGR